MIKKVSILVFSIFYSVACTAQTKDTMPQETILVTGGAGYIGSHTAHALTQQGYNVVIIDTLIHNQPFDHSWATLVKADCADTAVLDAIHKKTPIDAVMHFAAFAQVGESMRQPLKYYENNVSKTVTLLNWMLNNNIKKFIFSSSCAVYGNPEFLPLTEAHPKNPISPYGKTKLMIEQILEDLSSANGLRYVSLRYFNAAGALPEFGLCEHHEPETHIIPLLLNASKHRKPFTIFGGDYRTLDGSCVRDYLHVCDIAQAHLAALGHLNKGMPSDVFNLGTGTGASVKELVAAVQQTTQIPLKTIMGTNRAGDPPMLVADASKARDILGWKPTCSSLKAIIQSAWKAENLPH